MYNYWIYMSNLSVYWGIKLYRNATELPKPVNMVYRNKRSGGMVIEGL